MYLDLYLLIVSIGMGSVYVIGYFATYIQWRYMCTCTYSTYLIHVLPTSASAASGREFFCYAYGRKEKNIVRH